MANAATETPPCGLARCLIASGMLGREEAEAAQIAARHAELPFISYLVTHGLVEPWPLARALAGQFGSALIDLDAVTPDAELARQVGERTLRNHRILPLSRRGQRLSVALSDPTSSEGLDEIRFATGCTVEPFVCEEDKLACRLTQMLDALDSGLDGLEAGMRSAVVRDSARELSAAAGTPGEEPIAEEDVPVVRFVHKLMLGAIRRGASDIHFEPDEHCFRVRMRIDGLLQEVAKSPVTLAPRIASRLKVLAGLDIAERRLPQDGRIKLEYSRSRAMDFRVSSIPGAWGEKIVLRLLDPASAKRGVDALGFEDFQRELFLEALSRPQGMILVTGPTGSGKTLTLYSAVQALNHESRNICAAEDPIEVRLPGITQVQVHPRINLGFANALRAFLRQDPDVILVGEIRDLETAEIAVKAAQTGHLVLSTVHTNDAPKTLTRLRDIGLPPYSIASSLRLIIAQRLLRLLCRHCHKQLTVPDEVLETEGFDAADIRSGVTVYGAVGCSRCMGGYRGRTGIFELMPVTEEMGHAIMSEARDADIARLARHAGMWNLRRSGLAKVKAGLTSLDELRRVTTD